MFTTQQIQELLQIVDYHNSFVVATILGKDSLTPYDKYVLQENGIDLDALAIENPTYFQMYLFGKLSGVLSNTQGGQVDYENFKKHVKQGQYIPLSKNEMLRYDIAKQRTYNHLKGMAGKQKEFVTNIISKEIAKGVEERKTLKSIISEIGHSTETWNKDWGRIVDTEMNNIFQQGRAEAIKQKSGDNALVFKDVYSGACRHCIKHYLTAGIGSQPRVFKLNELQANGSNIGRKQADWLPTVDSMHPACRCTLRELPENYVWNEESNKFEPQKYVSKRTVKAVLKVGDKEFLI